MTHEEQIAKLTEMLVIQQKLQETAVGMLKPAVDAAYQKGYADAMGWKTQNHLEHLSQRQPLTDEQKYALIEKHLGLKKRRDNTVIDPWTGRYTDAQRYFDLIDEAAHGIKENT
jgi:hypothetical protein